VPTPRIYRTSAIVLSRFDLGEADRVLTLLTPEEGKLKARWASSASATSAGR
jgi:recombinational DNA repair protein (RecF pathway)